MSSVPKNHSVHARLIAENNYINTFT